MLTIWCNAKFSDEVMGLLRDGTEGHRLVMAATMTASNLQHAQADPLLASADVALGQPDPAAIMGSSRLKWIHLTSAGYERYDRDDARAALRARGAQLTTSSTVYAEPCALHVLAMMLSLTRQLPAGWENQRSARGWPGTRLRAGSNVLVGQTALILGYGAIARRLIEMLAPMRMKIVAVRRHVRGDEVVPAYQESKLDELLPTADHVIDVLPGGEGTRGMVSAARFARMKVGARFYNIGRGQTVDQAGLLDALRSGRVGAAYLDVMEPEPLPPEHPLWTMPNCFITPHSAGGQVLEMQRIVEHFLANLGRLARGEPLADRVM